MSRKSAIVSGFGIAMQLGVTMDELRRECGVTEDEFYVLATPDGRPHLKRMIAGLKTPVEISKEVVYLKRLFADERIVLDPSIEVTVYKHINDGTFRQCFISVGQPLDQMTFTTEQINEFATMHRERLSEEYRNCFLSKDENGFFVRSVDGGSSVTPSVRDFPLSLGSVWSAWDCERRFFIPQLKTAATPTT